MTCTQSRRGGHKSIVNNEAPVSLCVPLHDGRSREREDGGAEDKGSFQTQMEAVQLRGCSHACILSVYLAPGPGGSRPTIWARLLSAHILQVREEPWQPAKGAHSDARDQRLQLSATIQASKHRTRVGCCVYSRAGEKFSGFWMESRSSLALAPRWLQTVRNKTFPAVKKIKASQNLTAAPTLWSRCLLTLWAVLFPSGPLSHIEICCWLI